MGPEADVGEDPALPPLLADQIALIEAQLAPDVSGADILRFIDAAVLNICEHVDVDLEILNRVMAMRAAADRLAVVREDLVEAQQDNGAALAQAELMLAALLQALVNARPSAMSNAMGQGWKT